MYCDLRVISSHTYGKSTILLRFAFPACGALNPQYIQKQFRFEFNNFGFFESEYWKNSEFLGTMQAYEKRDKYLYLENVRARNGHLNGKVLYLLLKY